MAARADGELAVAVCDGGDGGRDIFDRGRGDEAQRLELGVLLREIGVCA